MSACSKRAGADGESSARARTRATAHAMALIVSMLTISACSRENKGEATPDAPTEPPAASATAVAPSVTAPPIAPSTASATPVSPALLTAAPVRGKAIGTTSLVLKLELEGGTTCAFKPRSTRPLGGVRYKSEIAAYRIARALGLDNVPAALPRAMPLAALRAALASGPDGAKADELVADPDGNVRGAILPWIRRERFDIDMEPNRSRWTEWLTSKTPSIPEKDVAIARQISTMLVFDYLTANWDRWSGDNIGIDRATGTVLYVDNDGAFYEAPNATQLASQLGFIRRVARFSRRFVAALRALSRHGIEAAVGEETAGVPILSKRLVDAAEERRIKLVGAIDARIAADGEASALSFD